MTRNNYISIQIPRCRIKMQKYRPTGAKHAIARSVLSLKNLAQLFFHFKDTKGRDSIFVRSLVANWWACDQRGDWCLDFGTWKRCGNFNYLVG